MIRTGFESIRNFSQMSISSIVFLDLAKNQSLEWLSIRAMESSAYRFKSPGKIRLNKNLVRLT